MEPQNSNIPAGAMVDKRQSIIIAHVFGLHPWSHVAEKPFELLQMLEKMDKA